jgi:hypothetical protein
MQNVIAYHAQHLQYTSCGRWLLVLISPKSVLYMLEEVVKKEKKQSHKVAGIKWLPTDKKIFLKEWKRKHKEMIDDGGLRPSQQGDVLPRFVSVIMMLISAAKHVIPLLQTVYQADTCCLNFGKYTLHTCYGITVNNNTFPVAMAILIRNEDKAGWVKFWQFALQIHTCLNLLDATIITDKAKGYMQD